MSPAATITATRFSRAMRQISSSAIHRIATPRRLLLVREYVAPVFQGSKPCADRTLCRSPFVNNYHLVTAQWNPRFFSSSSSSDSLCPKQIQVRLNGFQDLFVEARMCIDDVKDSLGTVYFEDDADDAREAVEAAINHFEALLEEITDIDEKNKVLRSNGLKVEQLKGELELTLSGGHDH